MVKEMRNLNPDESALTLKNMIRHKENAKYLEYRIAYCKLMLDTGFEVEYLRQKKEKMSEMRKYKEALDATMTTIKICEQQLKNGVPKKTPTPQEMEKEIEKGEQ